MAATVTYTPVKVNTSMVILIIIGVLALIGLGYYFYRRGKKTAEGPQVDIIEGKNTIPKGWSPVPLADKVYDAMSGLAWTDTKENAWLQALQLPNDDMLKAVYNAFNTKYYREGDGTLTQWIRDEYGAFFGSNKQPLLDRLMKANCP